jgi:hypothetical protein
MGSDFDGAFAQFARIDAREVYPIGCGRTRSRASRNAQSTQLRPNSDMEISLIFGIYTCLPLAIGDTAKPELSSGPLLCARSLIRYHVN